MTRHPPRRGRVLRTVGTAAGVALGVVGLVAQPAAALGGIMVGVVVGGEMALRLYERPGVDSRRCGIAAGGTAVWMWLIGTGLVVLLGMSTVAVLVALLLVGVPAALHLRRRFGPVQPVAPATAPATLMAPPILGTLCTPELCLAWRRSYLTLVELPAGPARAPLVAVRQSILDELERRDGDGFRRWLAAGARAAGDPARYLATGPGT